MEDVVVSDIQSLETQPLKSLGKRAVQHLLQVHDMSRYVAEIFVENNVDGKLLENVESILYFTEIGVKLIHAARLLKVVQEVQRSGVPANWISGESTTEELDTEATVAPALVMENIACVVKGPVQEPDRVTAEDEVIRGPTLCAPANIVASDNSMAHWGHEYERYYHALYLKDVSAVEWLEQQVVAGSNIAKAYMVVYFAFSNKEADRARLLAEELQGGVVGTWLQSSDVREKMHGFFIQGVCSMYGLGCKSDRQKSLEWYRRAADLEHIEALYRLGLTYAWESSEQASLYLRAAEKGHVEAQYQMGNRYSNGKGVMEDKSEAVRWYRAAADQGHADSQHTLGGKYRNGDGVTENGEEGLRWHLKAANQSHTEAQYQAGFCYYYGKGAKTEYVEAFKWLSKAAVKGYSASQSLLGECYYRGHGVAQDYVEAVSWYRKAAAQGCHISEFDLGRCYEHGHGVVADREGAISWYRKATASPVETLKTWAMDALKRLNASLT